MPAQRDKRRRRILELVAAGDLGTQDELARALARDGWRVTQSSISRDIAALGLVKVKGVYRRPARPQTSKGNPDEARIAETLHAAETSGGALIVLKTGPGEANHVAIALDRLSLPDIVGTIAGDDTIFVAVRDAAGQRRVLKRLRALSS